MTPVAFWDSGEEIKLHWGPICKNKIKSRLLTYIKTKYESNTYLKKIKIQNFQKKIEEYFYIFRVGKEF